MSTLLRTSPTLSPTLLRLTLGLVLFPHAAQKVFGWFGGGGVSGTLAFFSSVGIPTAAGIGVIALELGASIALVAGLATRVAALGVIILMLGAIVTVHGQFGFFMNWFGNQPGEGFEFHLLALAIAAALVLAGGGRLSVDRVLVRERR